MTSLSNYDRAVDNTTIVMLLLKGDTLMECHLSSHRSKVMEKLNENVNFVTLSRWSSGVGYKQTTFICIM